MLEDNDGVALKTNNLILHNIDIQNHTKKTYVVKQFVCWSNNRKIIKLSVDLGRS